MRKIRANLKPKKQMNAILNSASRHCSRFHASVHIQPYFIRIAFEKKKKKKKGKKPKLEKVKEISTKTIKIEIRDDLMSNFNRLLPR